MQYSHPGRCSYTVGMLRNTETEHPTDIVGINVHGEGAPYHRFTYTNSLSQSYKPTEILKPEACFIF